MKKLYKLSSLLFLLIGISCVKKVNSEKEILASWNEGSTKSEIIDYVEDVTDPESENFIPKSDRIATFDNDGTLWSEQPMYFQLFFVLDELEKMSNMHPEWKQDPLFKAALEKDMNTVLSFGHKGLAKLLLATHANISVSEFSKNVKQWISTSRHPRFNKPYDKLVYQPMLELLVYLRANGFKTFIVSGGGIDFMRPWAEEVYGIPSNQIIGSSIKAKFIDKEGAYTIEKLPELDFIDDKEGKPIAIQKFIGKKPVFAAGNSDGDLQMLEWTSSNKFKSFMLYVHHTDAEREWSYDRESSIGRLDKGLDESKEKGWDLIDMKNDWKVIYPFELKKE